MSSRITPLTFALCLLACGGTGSVGPDEVGSPAAPADAGIAAPINDKPFPDAGPPGECADLSQLFVARTLAQPRGSVVDTVLVPRPGVALAADYRRCIASDGAAWRREYEGSVVLLLVRPRGAAADTLAALELFLASRPASEPVALALWTDATYPIDLPTRDRARTLRLLERALVATPQVNDAAQIPQEASALLRGIGEPGRAWMRSLVLWAPQRTESVRAPERTADGRSVLSFGLAAPQGDLAQVAMELSRELDDALARGFYGVGFCQSGRVAIAAAGEQVELALAELPTELAQGPGCDRDVAAIQGFPASDGFALSFSGEQRERFDALVAAKARDDFELSVRWHSELPFTPARAHLRGQSSIDCVRKSYALDLGGGEPRPLLPGLLSDELHLLSMCLDDPYLNQLTADRLLAELELFPLAMQLVPLALDGQAQGLYLALEKPTDGLKRRLPHLHSVIRRNIDIDNKGPEVMFARVSAADSLAAYDALLSSLEGLEGTALVAALEAQLDLTQFLRWLALMSLLQNGDYVDELFLYATDSVGEAGEPRLFWSFLGWDPDDLFSNCHHSGRFAIVDPHELLFCAEGLLEHRIFADATVYDRYVSTLESVLEEVDQQRFDATLDATLASVLPFFADDEMRMALVEFHQRHPEASTKAAAEQLLADAARSMKEQFAARAELLRQRIAAYRSP